MARFALCLASRAMGKMSHCVLGFLGKEEEQKKKQHIHNNDHLAMCLITDKPMTAKINAGDNKF